MREIRVLFLSLKNGFYTKIDKEYHDFLHSYNIWSTYKKGEQVFDAKNKGVVESGQLQLEP